jgi:Eco57I restriction endonuclease.
MDKKAIKTFAIESRKKLIDEVKYQASLLGITAKGIAEPVEKAEGIEVYDIGASNPNTIYDEAIKQRKNLVKRINEKGFDNVVEEVAYTWFNRIMAIRFMEVNDYLPTRVRVLSSETEGKIEPDLVTEAPHIDLDFTKEEIDQIYQLKNDNKLDELFRLLFIKQCNKLNEILPELFEKTADYTELLLSISFTNEDGIIRQLVDNISEGDFKEQIEIIGWLYQFYNAELKDETFALLKKRVKVVKERVPTITQLFTPDWIVKYMVENSLGRLWLEHYPASNLKDNWKYYLESRKTGTDSQLKLEIEKTGDKLSPEDIKVIDPCMGSGHILVYVFEVLMDMYTSQGYNQRDAAELILQKNLYGLEIDDRAYQLAYFSVFMKARAYNRKILNKNLQLNVCSIQESNKISEDLVDFVAGGDLKLQKDLNYLKESFIDAKEYGSILNIKSLNFKLIYDKLDELNQKQFSDFKSLQFKDQLNDILKIVKQGEILSQKYDAFITNPPYMDKNGMNLKLSKYIKSNYNDSKKDLFSTFIEKSYTFTKNTGHIGLLTPYVWMFISSFSKLRINIIDNKSITTLTQLEYNAFPEACVPVCIFTLKNIKDKNYGEYIKLSDFKGIEIQEIKTLEAIKNKNCNFRFNANQNNFTKLPGTPIAYWANNNLIEDFVIGQELSSFSDLKQGLTTTDTKRFLRFWYEIEFKNIDFDSKNTFDAKNRGFKWFPYNKGGKFRRWYGNLDHVVNYHNDGEEIKDSVLKKYSYLKKPDFVVKNTKFYFEESLSWSRISSGTVAFRYYPSGFIFDDTGPSIFIEENMFYILGFLNSKVSETILSIISPTLHYEVGIVSLLPLIVTNKLIKTVAEITKKNIEICKEDWDSREKSWNFKIHPLLKFNFSKIKNAFDELNLLKENEYLKLKYNEIELNKIFIDIYNVKEILSSHVDDKYITLNKADFSRDIKSFISYSVGCMLGRYSLDEEGLIYAGGQWDPSKYSKFLPDEDNIIPILDTEYFEDDIVGRFVEFVKVTFGEETLEENLDFIAKALKKKGTTSREVIRNYFLTDFYKDHVKTYKKHPIYWLFDSGRNNGFKALIYMHRYEGDLVARVRTDYLHKTQKALETAIAHNDRIIETSTSASEKSKAVKAKNKLVKQLVETRKYDEALAHVANQKIQIDLDDGVKVNYAKFQGVEVSSEGKKAKKIDLLKKI